MADTDETGEDERVSLFDALVYAPIGLLFDGQELTPDLAKRGRQHAAAARQIGELAVKAMLRRFEESQRSETESSRVQRPPVDSTPEAEESDSAEPAGTADSDDDSDDRPSSDHLSITDYDLLAASQVVKRLDSLSADELEAVRVYESATRDRRTILHKIARLQGD